MSVKLPMASVPVPAAALAKLSEAGDGLIAGVRPEAFEDSALVGDKKNQGVVFKTKLDVVESLGSELFVHFALDHQGVVSQELQELAEDAGTSEVPGGGGARGRGPARRRFQSDLRAGSGALARHAQGVFLQTGRLGPYHGETPGGLVLRRG